MPGLKKNFSKYEYRTHLETGLRFSNYTLMTGLFLVGYAIAFGAGNILIGFLSAIPLFANLLQFVSAFILEKTGTKKKTALLSLLVAHLLWVPVVLAALGVIGHPLLIITAALAVYSLLTALGSLSMLSWLKDLVPTKSLSRVLGRRNTYAYVGGMIAYFGGSIVIDILPGTRTYGYIFLASILLGLAAIAFVVKVPEKKQKIKAISWENFRARWMQPFRDENFRPLLKFGASWGFALGLAAPFFLVYMLENLQLGFFISSIFLASDTIGRVVGYRIWAPIADRYGSKPTLAVTATISALTALLFFFIDRSNYVAIPLLWVVAGVSFAGTELSTYRSLFKAAPRQNDAYYLSAFVGVVGISTASAPVIGGFMITLLENYGPVWVEPIRYIFIITFIGRVLCIPLISKIYERDAKSVDDVLRKMKTVQFLSIFSGIYSLAFYASKVVLFPHKQLFFLQRRTTERLKKDMNNMVMLLNRVSGSLKSVNARNAELQKRKLRALNSLLADEVKQLGYIRGTMYLKIPRQILSGMNRLIHTWDTKKDLRKQSGALQRQLDAKLDKLEDAVVRNLK